MNKTIYLFSLLIFLNYYLPADAYITSNTGVVHASITNVRIKPIAWAPVIRQINRGELFTIIGRSSHKLQADTKYVSGKRYNTFYWYHVRLSSRITGWVLGKYIGLHCENKYVKNNNSSSNVNRFMGKNHDIDNNGKLDHIWTISSRNEFGDWENRIAVTLYKDKTLIVNKEAFGIFHGGIIKRWIKDIDVMDVTNDGRKEIVLNSGYDCTGTGDSTLEIFNLADVGIESIFKKKYLSYPLDIFYKQFSIKKGYITESAVILKKSMITIDEKGNLKETGSQNDNENENYFRINRTITRYTFKNGKNYTMKTRKNRPFRGKNTSKLNLYQHHDNESYIIAKIPEKTIVRISHLGPFERIKGKKGSWIVIETPEKKNGLIFSHQLKSNNRLFPIITNIKIGPILNRIPARYFITIQK